MKRILKSKKIQLHEDKLAQASVKELKKLDKEDSEKKIVV
jgi:hypothetical protein